MKHITTYTADTLNAAKVVSIPSDFPYYRRGKFLTEVEVTIESTGVVAGQIDITAKRIGSTGSIIPVDNGTITPVVGVPQSVTFFGSFSEVTVAPDATFTAAAGTYKLIINAGETE